MEIEKSQLDRQVDKLLEKEKNCRTINDHVNSAHVLKEIITLYYKAGELTKMCDMIKSLMGKRGQAKKAQIELVQLVMSWLPSIKDDTERMKIVETVREVADKKIFLEVEYARAVLMIVQNKEDANIGEAAKILQEVQVETYGSMSRREKLQFILYQMKVMIKRDDFIRLFIISKKINEANLNDDELVDLKVKYYAYMAIYYNQEHKYYETAKCYKTLWESLKKNKKVDLPQKTDFDFSIAYMDVLACYLGFLVLEPYSDKQKKELEALFTSEEIEGYPHIYHLVSAFLSRELVSCNVNDYNLDHFLLFGEGFKNSAAHKQTLYNMLVQHNIKVMSECYERLSMPRIANLISVKQEDAEEQLCNMMNRKLVTCHIDRLDQTVDFKPPQNENSVLEKWNFSINKILELIDEASDLIHRENEIASLTVP